MLTKINLGFWIDFTVCELYKSFSCLLFIFLLPEICTGNTLYIPFCYLLVSVGKDLMEEEVEIRDSR